MVTLTDEAEQYVIKLFYNSFFKLYIKNITNIFFKL